MNHKDYTTSKGKNQGQILYYKPYPAEARKAKLHPVSIALRAILAALIIAVAVLFATGNAEEITTKCFVLCKPGDRVNLRLSPSKGARCVGWLECGDSFQTDGTSKNGWIRVMDAGECDCWIYSGYVVTEKPEDVFESYVCVARNRVACRRWVDGPQIDGRLGWLHNGSNVSVFAIAGEWAVTSRGYIRAEWLEVDPA